MNMPSNTKKTLHTNKCNVEVVNVSLGRGPEKRYVVQYSLTEGELLAMTNAIHSYDTRVGQDIAAYLENAAHRAGIEV